MKKVLNALHSIPLRRILPLCCGLLICMTLWAEAQQQHLADQVIRLHVLANSDSPADQTLKLAVRDEILAQTNTLLSGEETAAEAEAILRENLTQLSYTASEKVFEEGYFYNVHVTLEDTWFPTRQYENISLPAGTYKALRIIIGEGLGKNWWCVVFPSLCMSAVTEETAQAVGLSGEDYALLSEESPSYEIRFKAVEWWELCKHHLFG